MKILSDYIDAGVKENPIIIFFGRASLWFCPNTQTSRLAEVSVGQNGNGIALWDLNYWMISKMDETMA